MNGPMMMQTICNAVGMVNELGQPDAQFIRFLDGRLNGFLVYLTHLSEPQKEQYSASALFGSSYMLAEYGKAATKFVRNELDMSDCVLGCLDWISNQRGYIIRWSGFARWAANSPFFRGASSPLVRHAIDEHNNAIYNRQQWDTVQTILDPDKRAQTAAQFPACSPEFNEDEWMTFDED